ncbi:hypothetical protein H6796_02860 [Candidatus Nomurabacteria bacterium]|nr:hypothetical protein [Candidatus Nomurabacteria bacterium]
MNQQISSMLLPLRPVGVFFARFHYLIFFVIVGALVAIAILTIISITGGSSGPGQTVDPAAQNPTSATSGFDKETIEALDRLSAKDADTNTSLPGGRINPFVE